MHKPTKTIVTISIIYFITTFALVIYGFSEYHKVSEKKCVVHYVSREEVLNLEMERIKFSKDQQIFFGRIEDAFAVIEKSANFRVKRCDVIVFSDGKVSGRNVVSISKAIHEEIINNLTAR